MGIDSRIVSDADALARPGQRGDNAVLIATHTIGGFVHAFTNEAGDGWKLVEVPFSDFVRRSDFQPEGAPDDGFNLTEVHGYAILFPPDDGVERIDYFDDFALYAP
jgi:hypothetical protein